MLLVDTRRPRSRLSSFCCLLWHSPCSSFCLLWHCLVELLDGLPAKNFALCQSAPEHECLAAVLCATVWVLHWAGVARLVRVGAELAWQGLRLPWLKVLGVLGVWGSAAWASMSQQQSALWVSYSLLALQGCRPTVPPASRSLCDCRGYWLAPMPEQAIAAPQAGDCSGSSPHGVSTLRGFCHLHPLGVHPVARIMAASHPSTG